MFPIFPGFSPNYHQKAKEARNLSTIVRHRIEDEVEVSIIRDDPIARGGKRIQKWRKPANQRLYLVKNAEVCDLIHIPKQNPSQRHVKKLLSSKRIQQPKLPNDEDIRNYTLSFFRIVHIDQTGFGLGALPDFNTIFSSDEFKETYKAVKSEHNLEKMNSLDKNEIINID